MPPSVNAGTPFPVPLYVVAEDANGNVDSTFDGSVTIALDSNPGNATLGGTVTVPAIDGVAVFSDLTMDRAGTGYTLGVSSGSLSPASTDLFDVIGATVTPLSLTWNKTQGGVDLSYQVNEDLQQGAPVAFYWAKSANYSDIIDLDNPVYTYMIPAGTLAQAQAYGPIHIDGTDLTDAPAGATYLLAVADPDNTLGNFDPIASVQSLQLVLDVQHVYQNQGYWADSPKDYILGHPPSADTISSSGCGLVSLDMALNYQGIQIDPVQLNALLTAAPDGYDGLDHVNWEPATFIAAGATGYSTIHFDSEYYGSSNPQDLRDLLTSKAAPVIVSVFNPDSRHQHFVLVTGIDGDTFTINDPAYPYKANLNAYGNAFQIRGSVVDPPSDISALCFATAAPGTGANLAITDPQGNVTGLPSGSGQLLDQIPNSVYFTDGPVENLTGSSTDDTTAQFVYISQPGGGSYGIQTSGTTARTQLDLAYAAPDGALQAQQAGTVQSSSGAPLQYQVNLGSTGASLVKQLVLTWPPQFLTPGQSPPPITVQIQDSRGDAIAATSDVTVQLSSSSSTGQFLDLSGNPLANSSIVIPAGSSSAQFEYVDTQTGFPTLSTQAPGFFGSTQQEDEGVGLTFAMPPQTLTPGQSSQPITVQLKDLISGNAFTAPSGMTVNLSSSSSTGQFLDTSGNPLANSSIVIPAGSSSASFEYEDTQVGLPTLTARSFVVLNLQIGDLQVENVGGVSLAFTTAAQTLTAGQPSQPITLRFQDGQGNPVVAPAAGMIIQLSSSSSTGVFLDTSGNRLFDLYIPAGSSSASFVYEDVLGGTPTLTASVYESSVSVTQQESVQGGAVLAFTTAAQTLTAGQPSAPITVQLQDGQGKPVTVPAGAMYIQLSSSSNTGVFLDTSGNRLSVLYIPAGSSSASFEYEDSQGGMPTLTASVSGSSVSATQQETVQQGARVYLEIFAPLQTITPGQPSKPITVKLQDLYGNVITATSDVTMQLSSSSSTGQFLDTSGNPLANSSLVIHAGSSSVQFEYEDSQVGLPTLSARAQGVAGFLPATVDVGVSLVFTTAAQSLTVGQPSAPITVQLQDGQGNPVAAPTGGMPVILTSSSKGGKFLDTSSNPLPYPYINIPAGSSSASFEYEDSLGGTPQLFALSNAGYAAQLETVAGPGSVVFATPAQAITLNQPSQVITVQLQDSNGKVMTATSDVTVTLSSSSSTGQFLNPSGNPLANSSLVIPAGSSSAQFEYEDSQAGFPTLMAAANGLTSGTQTETINVNPAPVALSQSVTMNQGKAKAITLSSTDPNGDPLTYSITTQPQDGQLTGSGADWTYTPNAGFSGTDSFQFNVEDTATGLVSNIASVNLIVAIPPASTVAALPTYSPGTITLNWSGSDANGNGIASYSVFVSDNGGTFTPLLTNTTQTSTTFTGINGHTYGFYSIATDDLGVVQPTPSSAQATTTVDAVAPSSTVAPVSTFSQSSFAVNWSGSDNIGGSGLANYSVYVSDTAVPSSRC
jgi:hypothetical protein